MPEIQIDVAVANRFISSLSKSLQALCHGCMDFDTGIEIVGYINVNIDSGSKVDYVLNEKVLKSTTNSMTFVSNSFFAKKEQPKQSRDGSCSPIPELVQPPQMMSPYQSRMRGSHPRTSAPFSQAYGMRGSHKRSWASMERDWRMSPKRQREGRPQYPMSHDPSSSSSAQSAHFSATSTSSSQNPADPNFGWNQPSAQSSDTLGSDTQSNVNIKKEVLDSDTNGSSAQTEQEQSQSADQTMQSNSDPNSSATGINIKRDPDASTSAADEETPTSEGATTDTDFKGTFLQPSTENPHPEATAAEESDSTAAAPVEEQDISQTESSNQNSAAENISDNHEDNASSEMLGDDVTPASDMPVEYDEAGEEGAYPQSVYSDMGEGSSDAGQFEVIEIDDEDEDVQAMFGESRVNRNRRKRKHPQWVNPSYNPSLQSPVSLDPHLIELEQDQEAGLSQRSFVSPGDGNSQRCSVEICSTCRIALPLGVTYQQHFTEAHATETAGLPFIGADPYICEICQKGFITKERLRQHATVHDSAYISCYICDVKLKHKKNLKRHLESTHNLRKCPHCYVLIPKGKEYDSHCKTCCGDQESNGV